MHVCIFIFTYFNLQIKFINFLILNWKKYILFMFNYEVSYYKKKNEKWSYLHIDLYFFLNEFYV